MYNQTITWTDYNGTKREEPFYFNLNQAELIHMNVSEEGSLQQRIERIIQTQNQPEIAKVFEQIIDAAYGEKSADGKRFIKKVPVGTDANGNTIYHRLVDDFKETEAYSILYTQLFTDDEAAAAFINGVVPKIDQPADK